jgi:uncharacterized protein (TIGR02391 family)
LPGVRLPAHTGYMAAIDPLPSGALRRICDVLGDTAEGLTGRQIATLLREACIDDPGEMTKRDRLFEAFRTRQAKDRAANSVLACLKLALSPDRFLDRPDAFDSWRTQINEALAFAGLTITDEGAIQRLARAASTLSQARARANRFRDALRERHVHHLVISGCAAEIEDENYFHAVFETTKNLADRIRSMTGLSEDGTALIDRVFGRKSSFPVLALNKLESRTDESEHDGYANMLRGLFGAFRNTTAHRPKVAWPISEQDALDMMTTASLLHRRLDSAVIVPVHLRAAA